MNRSRRMNRSRKKTYKGSVYTGGGNLKKAKKAMKGNWREGVLGATAATALMTGQLPIAAGAVAAFPVVRAQKAKLKREQALLDLQQHAQLGRRVPLEEEHDPWDPRV